MLELETSVRKLCAASEKLYADPYQAVDWPEVLDRDQWFFSPELISMKNTTAYEAMNERQKKELSFWEAVNFFSLNIHGEKPLVEGLAHRLYARRNEPVVDAYLHHFLDEENKHMIWFGGFCQRYAGKVYLDKKMAFPREYAPGEEDFLFFAKVLIFEEIVDVYNIRMARDERLHPLVRRINLLHHQDEARHLAFGRRYTRELFERCKPSWSEETLTGLRQYLSGYVNATWKEYFNPQVYTDAGISGNMYALQEEAFNNAPARAHRREIGENALKFLKELGLWKCEE